MSTTVNYKGNTIATLSNETKTLTTAGTWVEGNIEIVDTMEDFIITLSYNSTTEMWEPDKTFAEIQSANTSGKSIYLKLIIDGGHLNYSVDGKYTSNGYEYVIRECGNDLESHYYVNEYYYVFNSNGLNIVDNYIYYDTSDSDVIASKVASGTTFYGSTGYAIGSAPIRSSTDLTVSGATVTAPAGFYSSDATKSVASGTEGTPIATKGTVSNHQISVTPSVTNTAGYITGGIKTGTAVTVTASELASGNKAIADNGDNIDVVGYSTVSVNVEPEDFIITLSYNSTTEMWEPDCTYSSILAAYNNNKNIIFYIGTSDGYADGYIHPVRLNVLYRVYEDYYDSSTESNGCNTTFYVYDSNGLTNEGNYISYDTYDADTVASSVPSGNIFYNSTGRVVGTAPSRSSTDLTASGATVTAPAGYYATSASKSVASGTAGTPSVSKGTVSNHQISITPSVTNTTGYITGGTKTGTAVTVTASELASGNKEITSNGTDIDVVGYSTVSVDVQPSLQSKTGINPSTSNQTISPDSGYYGLSSVQINAMPAMTLPISASSSSSGTSKATIGRSTSAQYINIPTGYNGTASYYTISATPNGSATTPATTITANPTITVSSSGLITATASASQNITPTVSAGYVSSGTAGTVTVSGSKTQQLTTKGATTYNTSTTDQTIASGTYLTGTQTIKAVTVSGLDASKILSGTTVMIGDANDADRITSVTGTVTFSTIRTGTSTPASSLGENGDIYVKTS